MTWMNASLVRRITALYVRHVIHACLCYHQFVCVTWRIHVCTTIYVHAWRDVFIRVTWRNGAPWHVAICDIERGEGKRACWHAREGKRAYWHASACTSVCMWTWNWMLLMSTCNSMLLTATGREVLSISRCQGALSRCQGALSRCQGAISRCHLHTPLSVANLTQIGASRRLVHDADWCIKTGLLR